MILTRAPLRISIGGGGTDLKSYYEKFGGFFISAAINQYVYLAIHRNFNRNYKIKYSQSETTESVEQIQHPIFREALRIHQIEPMVEIVSLADIPAGTGLGSSGSFTVALLKGLHSLKKQHVSTQDLAEEACKIEIDILKEPIGKQDQYIASFGSLTCFEIDKSGHVQSSPLQVSNDTIAELQDNLLLFFTGFSRSASDILQDQKVRSEENDKQIFENLHFVKELGFRIKAALESGRVRDFGGLLHEHWENKRNRSGKISNSQVDEWYELARQNGAIGGKLIGAGGGGFFLFYTEEPKRLRQCMKNLGLNEVRYSFDFEGAKVISY
jgi:D-glycero-alpha-D-manno-heptose-7-phosphate kinase